MQCGRCACPSSDESQFQIIWDVNRPYCIKGLNKDTIGVFYGACTNTDGTQPNTAKCSCPSADKSLADAVRYAQPQICIIYA